MNIKLLCKKTYKSLLALMIMFSMFPQFTETVVAEETTIPVEQFATVDQLKSFNTNDNDGVACFYIEFDNLDENRKVINFFLENNLIPKTKNGRYYDISFKTDEQTLNGEYGNDFKAKMKLHQFIDLKNGKWIK